MYVEVSPSHVSRGACIKYTRITKGLWRHAARSRNTVHPPFVRGRSAAERGGLGAKRGCVFAEEMECSLRDCEENKKPTAPSEGTGTHH